MEDESEKEKYLEKKGSMSDTSKDKFPITKKTEIYSQIKKKHYLFKETKWLGLPVNYGIVENISIIEKI